VNGILAALQRFGLGRLAAFAGIGVGVVAVLAAVFMNLDQPNALLYSNLDLKEAGEITQALDQANIRYEARGDGSTIMVSRDQVASTRLLLSGRGLPTAGSVGYEIFDQSSSSTVSVPWKANSPAPFRASTASLPPGSTLSFPRRSFLRTRSSSHPPRSASPSAPASRHRNRSAPSKTLWPAPCRT
jgi:hypothetical protein